MNSHKHEWVTAEDPLIEDSAAIYYEYCNWKEVTSTVHSKKHDETFYGYGDDCNAERHYRMEAQAIIHKRDNKPDITYIVDGDLPYFMEEKFVHVEKHGSIIDLYPDEDCGFTIVESSEARIHYKA
jgi:hypothetical protein